MADRKSLAADGTMSEEKIEEVMVSAIKGMAIAGGVEVVPTLVELSKQDPSLKVRQAAMEALEYQKQNSVTARKLAA
jgi:HEAT repeat protein